jgi:hypothetical protein
LITFSFFFTACQIYGIDKNFIESLQILNFLFTFTMNLPYIERNASRQGKLSRIAYRQNLGCFTAYFGHIPKKGGFSLLFDSFLPKLNHG